MSKLGAFFVKNAIALCEKYKVDVNIASYESEVEAYKAMVDAGIDQDDIISYFENALSLTFVDVREKALCYSAIKKDKLADLVEHVRVFPFEDGNMLKVAISNLEQMEYTENIMEAQNYSYVFCFQFLIDEELAKVDLAKEEVGLDHAEKSLTKVITGRKTIILATGRDEIDSLINEADMFTAEYKVTNIIQDRNLLYEYCENDTPDILLLGENIGGARASTLSEVIFKLHFAFPEMRIIYLCGEVDPKDETRRQQIGNFVAAGIYDIVTTDTLSITALKKLLDVPTEKDAMKEWLENIKDKDSKKNSNIEIILPKVDEETQNTAIYANLYTFTGAKGGVGKSFIVDQVAIAIATCGIKRSDGNKPRVGIIDLDFQGFTTSTYFKTLHEKENIFMVLDNLKRVIGPLGENLNPGIDVETEVHEIIKKCFKTTSKYSNIKVLGGTDRLYHAGDKDKINNYYLTYIVESMIDEFDILLVDGNTDMDASIIYPLYSMSNTTYYIIDMDWNTFHATKRFRMYLDEESFFIGEQSKFILNKATIDDELTVGIKDIENGLGIGFSNIFPLLNTSTMFNMACKSDNIIQSDDKKLDEIKYYFLKLANDLYPIVNWNLIDESFTNKATFKISKKALKDNAKNDKIKKEKMGIKEEAKKKLSLTDAIKEFLDNFKFKKLEDIDDNKKEKKESTDNK